MSIQYKPLKAPVQTVRWEPISWSDEYLLGNRRIDEDHKRLFELYNELAEAANTGKNDVFVQEVLTELLENADRHFDDEERIMEKIGYPELEQHKVSHEKFMQSLYDTNNHLEAGGEMGAYVLEILSEWLLDHMRNDDLQLAQYIRSKTAA